MAQEVAGRRICIFIFFSVLLDTTEPTATDADTQSMSVTVMQSYADAAKGLSAKGEIVFTRKGFCYGKKSVSYEGVNLSNNLLYDLKSISPLQKCKAHLKLYLQVESYDD